MYKPSWRPQKISNSYQVLGSYLTVHVLPLQLHLLNHLSPYLKDVSVGLALIGVLELGVADEDGVHVGAGVLVELAVARDHHHGNLHVTKDAQLIRLLQETGLTLAEGDLEETNE